MTTDIVILNILSHLKHRDFLIFSLNLMNNKNYVQIILFLLRLEQFLFFTITVNAKYWKNEVLEKVLKHFWLNYFLCRKLDVAIANLMCVEISVTPVKLVIMLLKTKIILAAKVKNVSSSTLAFNTEAFGIP